MRLGLILRRPGRRHLALDRSLGRGDVAARRLERLVRVKVRVRVLVQVRVRVASSACLHCFISARGRSALSALTRFISSPADSAAAGAAAAGSGSGAAAGAGAGGGDGAGAGAGAGADGAGAGEALIGPSRRIRSAAFVGRQTPWVPALRLPLAVRLSPCEQ